MSMRHKRSRSNDGGRTRGLRRVATSDKSGRGSSKTTTRDASSSSSSSGSSRSSSSARASPSANTVVADAVPREVTVLAKHFQGCHKPRALKGHSKKVHSVAWNCNGKSLASCSADGTARIWQLDKRGTVASQKELKGHSDYLYQVAWHPSNPDVLATASGDKTVRIWNAKTGKASVVDHKGQNINITWNPSGTKLAVGNKADVISIIDADKLKIEKSHGFSFEANEMLWSPCGNFFLCATGNGTVEIYKFPSFERVHSIQAHAGYCPCIAFDPKGRYLATGGADAMVTLWDLEELVCVRTFPRLDSPVRTLSFSHDGRLLASASEDHRIDISAVESGLFVHSIQCELSKEMNSIAWSPSALILAVGGSIETPNPTPSGHHYRQQEYTPTYTTTGSVHVFGYS